MRAAWLGINFNGIDSLKLEPCVYDNADSCRETCPNRVYYLDSSLCSITPCLETTGVEACFVIVFMGLVVESKFLLHHQHSYRVFLTCVQYNTYAASVLATQTRS